MKKTVFLMDFGPEKQSSVVMELGKSVRKQSQPENDILPTTALTKPLPYVYTIHTHTHTYSEPGNSFGGRSDEKNTTWSTSDLYATLVFFFVWEEVTPVYPSKWNPSLS